jgi:hypothetical protein
MFKKIKEIIAIIQILGLFKKLKEAFMNNNNGVKPGWKTSEFWLGIFSIIVTIYSKVQGIIPPELMVKVIAILSGVYMIARGIAKLTKTTADDELLDKIDKIISDKMQNK